MKSYSFIVLFFLLITGMQVYSQKPNQPCGPMTFYNDEKKVKVILKLINDMKELCVVNRNFYKGIELEKGSNVFYSKIAFGYLKNKVKSKPVYDLKGKDENNKEVLIDFSILEEMSILEIKNNTAKIYISLFPDIAPEELLKKNLTYSELSDADKYRKRIVLSILIDDPQNGELGFLNTVNNEFLNFKDIKRENLIKFAYYFITYENEKIYPIWWAIPSVIKDTNYKWVIECYKN